MANHISNYEHPETWLIVYQVHSYNIGMHVYISHAIMQEVQSLLSISLLKQYLMLHMHISIFLEHIIVMYFMDTILYTSGMPISTAIWYEN